MRCSPAPFLGWISCHFSSVRGSRLSTPETRALLSRPTQSQGYFFRVISLSVVVSSGDKKKVEIISNMFCRRCRRIDFSLDEPMVACSCRCGGCFCHSRCRRRRRRIDVPWESVLEWRCRRCRQLYRLQLCFEVASSQMQVLGLGNLRRIRLAASRKTFTDSPIEFCVACGDW